MRTRTARWIEFGAFGGTEVLQEAEGPIPRPGPGEVLVQVVAAALNHLDTYIRRGDFAADLPVTFPARQGTCFAGIVLERGDGVKDLPVGAEVLGHDPAHGAHATHVVVPEGALVRKPAPVPWEVAGSLYLAGTTALAVVKSLRIDGEVVVITAAAGGVGHIECQLARRAGATVVAVAGRENHDYLRSIGATPVAYGDGLEARIREAAKGRPIGALIDNYDGYSDLATALGVRPDRFVPSSRRRELEVRLVRAPGTDPEARMLVAELVDCLANWDIRVLVSGFYAMEQVIEASEDLELRHSRGKVVLGMRTTAPASTYLRRRMRSVHEQPA